VEYNCKITPRGRQETALKAGRMGEEEYRRQPPSPFDRLRTMACQGRKETEGRME